MNLVGMAVSCRLGASTPAWFVPARLQQHGHRKQSLVVGRFIFRFCVRCAQLHGAAAATTAATLTVP